MMARKILVATMMTAVILTGCSGNSSKQTSALEADKMVESVTDISMSTNAVTYIQFEPGMMPNTITRHTVCGRVTESSRLEDSGYGIVKIQPLKKGGEIYDEYPETEYYVPASLMADIETADWSDPNVALGAVVCDNADNKDDCKLLDVMLDCERITTDDIPTEW